MFWILIRSRMVLVVLGLTVLGFNLLGDALRDVLDPKLGSGHRSL